MMPDPRRVVVALGGNALLRRGEPLDVAHQRANVAAAARAIARIAPDHQLVVTHGNGPQVGLLALQSEAYTDVAPYPLDVLDAESEGMIGYLLDQRLTAELPDQPVATVLTQVVVDPSDPAFASPSKPIGPVYDTARGARLAIERGWSLIADGAGVRRVVPSPAPLGIVELPTITTLLNAGVLVICAGGGGIPIALSDDDDLQGVEAVVDKDATAALLAREIGAGVLLLLTDIAAVSTEWGSPESRDIRSASPTHLRRYHFAAGSMAPKIDAACRFVNDTGGRAAIGRLTDAADLLAGTTGTQIRAHATLLLADRWTTERV